MNADQLLAHYERIADAPDAIRRLRRFVLDLAVRGKLAAQDPNDEPASELLKRIAAEKARIVREGKFKVFEGDFDRNPEAFPFSIPANWSWCNLDDLAAVARGGSPRPIKSFITDDPNGIPWIKIGDSTRGNIYIDKTQERIKPEGLAKSRLVVPGDLLLSNSMSFGFPYITNIEGCIHDGWLVIRTPDGLIDKLYLHSVFLSDHAKAAFSEAASGAVVQNLNADKARQLAVPLPPLAEQHRIVAKVDELMALCDQLEAARAEREAVRDRMASASLARLTAPDADPAALQAHATFTLDNLTPLTTRPDQIKPLRQTILNLAVRGKLVAQDPNDEPASELLKRLRMSKNEAFDEEGLRKRKPVPRLDRRDIPFDFPRTWELPSFDDLFVIASGVTKGGKVPAETAVELPYLRVANVQRGHLDLAVMKRIVVKKSDQERYRLKNDDILMTEGGDWDKLGRAAIWRNEIADCIHQNHIFRVRPPSQEILPEWVVVYVNSELGRRFFEDASKQTTNLASINMTQLRGCPIPLPPLAEQHRIMARVDALMALCDRLEAALTTADTTRARLLEALLHEALQPAEMTMEAAE